MKVYNFGSLNIDYVYDVQHIVTSGETIASLGYSKHVGGKGLNQSISFSKAGMEVIHLGCIGTDGQLLLDALVEAKVNISHIQTLKETTGHAIIQLDQEGNNCILLHAGANHQVSKEYIDAMFAMIDRDDLIVLQNEISNIDYIVDKAYEQNIAVALNLSPVDDKILKIDLNKITYLLINETEGHALTDLVKGDDIGNYLIRHYPELTVVLTLGSQGAMYFDKHETISQAAFKAKAIDTTAAGDTFTGYFLSMLLRGYSAQKALQIGCYASSLAIQTKGAANSIPQWESVMKHFNG